jgi:hypothetical protein
MRVSAEIDVPAVHFSRQLVSVLQQIQDRIVQASTLSPTLGMTRHPHASFGHIYRKPQPSVGTFVH